VIATKFGFDMEGAGRTSGLDSRPETVKSGVEDRYAAYGATTSSCSISTASIPTYRSSR
jgi:hypothetical protein